LMRGRGCEAWCESGSPTALRVRISSPARCGPHPRSYSIVVGPAGVRPSFGGSTAVAEQLEQVCAPAHPELVVDAADVPAHRHLADPEAVRDLPGREAAPKPVDHLRLARRELDAGTLADGEVPLLLSTAELGAQATNERPRHGRAAVH